jgi:hypothetical protein
VLVGLMLATVDGMVLFLTVRAARHLGESWAGGWLPGALWRPWTRTLLTVGFLVTGSVLTIAGFSLMERLFGAPGEFSIDSESEDWNPATGTVGLDFTFYLPFVIALHLLNWSDPSVPTVVLGFLLVKVLGALTFAGAVLVRRRSDSPPTLG